jgi:hypothetical protein
MSNQQTITQCFAKTKQQQYQPVAKHVHGELVKNWAKAIVTKAGKVGYIPPNIHRSAKNVVYNQLMELTSRYGTGSTSIVNNDNDNIGRKMLTMMCVRLREAPLKTLLRASRLYLCATSGPGDMRGDGTNAWRSLPSSDTTTTTTTGSSQKGPLPLRTNIIAPPGAQSWHTVAYPGKDWRMRLKGCYFTRSYVPLSVDDDHDDNGSSGGSSSKETQTVEGRSVFYTVQAFHSWEAAVELRANVDYLLELNDMVLYEQRKQATRRENEEEDVLSEEDDCDDDEEEESSGSERSCSEGSHVDVLGLLTIPGRANLIRGLRGIDQKQSHDLTMIQKVEQEVSKLLGTPIGEIPLIALSGLSESDNMALSSTTRRRKTRCHLENECEKILGVITVILIHLLERRAESASRIEIDLICKRPWLRHLTLEGCLAYLLWDTFPIMERRGYYDIAIDALEVLVFGKRLPKNTDGLPFSLVDTAADNKYDLNLASAYLSRRARGKAYDRLIIDYTHTVRQERIRSKIGQKTSSGPKQKNASKNCKKKKNEKQANPNELVAWLTEPLLRSHAVSGRISFSSIRTLARRLKRPLSLTLNGLSIFEVSQLGHRLENDSDSQINASSSKYSDWTPVTDTAVANSIASDRNSVGGRCAFVGFEVDDDISIHTRSLNVEELAKEFYSLGKLPESNDFSLTWAKGGWVGYHDEGGKIRALFNILSSTTLGMDWTHNTIDDSRVPTIHLTPYQGSPFDLHVAEGNGTASEGCGIYVRRKAAIDSFLDELASLLNEEEVSDLVYDNIKKRLEYLKSINHVDASLECEVEQVRTLSMLAAGFGGKMLSAVFRCLFFDYRHYSGGLPDLLLVRALYRDTGDLVDLGDWVGETFSAEYQAALKAGEALQILGDKDDEFLGCSKVGDSGGRASNRFNQRPVHRKTSDSSTGSQLKDLRMPESLKFEHNGQKVRVECMCVEVKSQNDRLDPRQEDWLNILDRFGNARVCKFVKATVKPENSKPKRQEK